MKAAGVAWAVAGCAVALLAVALVLRSSIPNMPGIPSVPPATSSHVEVRPAPVILLAARNVGRLEGATFHMERVVELTDRQSKLWGLVQTKDAVLLVAAGDVTAGVDLSALRDGDVTVDGATHRATLRLPAPEVFSARIDNQRTHVYSRTTDTLASRREDLEGRARSEAESSIRAAAVEGGILERARRSTERTLRALFAPLGFTDVAFEWRAPD